MDHPLLMWPQLQQRLASSPYQLGRAFLDVIKAQLNDPVYEKLLIRGEN